MRNAPAPNSRRRGKSDVGHARLRVFMSPLCFAIHGRGEVSKPKVPRQDKGGEDCGGRRGDTEVTTLEERLKDYELVVKGQALGGWPLPAVDIELLIAALRNERAKRGGAD